MDNPKYRHECIEWDFMEIDENSSELVACSCFEDEDFKLARERHCLELQKHNEKYYPLPEELNND